MTEKTEKKLLQRILIISSGLVFLGSSGIFLVSMFSQKSQPSQPVTPATTASVAQQLQAREQGYLAVLQREPNNRTALEGLAQTRIQMNNLQAAKEPVKKLVKLYPQQKEYQVVLNAINQQLGVQSQPGK